MLPKLHLPGAAGLAAWLSQPLLDWQQQVPLQKQNKLQCCMQVCDESLSEHIPTLSVTRDIEKENAKA